MNEGRICRFILLSFLCLVITDSASAAKGKKASKTSAAVPVEGICVRNYARVPISNQEVDDIVSGINKLMSLINNDSGNSCPFFPISRLGSVSPYLGELPESLSNSYDFFRLTSDSCVKIVSRILWCGEDLSLNTVYGCAPIGSSGMVVVRSFGRYYPSSPHPLEPILWLHEYGHTKGLHHNNDLPQGVMNSNIDTTNTKMNYPECSAFRPRIAISPLDSRGAYAAEGGSPEVGSKDYDSPSVSIEEFVKRGNIRVTTAAGYRGSEGRLLQMLSDPEFQPFQPSIFGVLAVIGTEGAVNPTIDYLKSAFKPGFGETDIAGRAVAMLALASMVNRLNFPPEKADIIRQAQFVKFWHERFPLETAPPPNQRFPAGYDEYEKDTIVRDLTTQAINAYSITGLDVAINNLNAQMDMNAAAAVPAEIKQYNQSVLNKAATLAAKTKVEGVLSVFPQ